MAYGNASKKNVPLDALSQEDLNNIADKVSEKIPNEQKQQIQDLNARTEQVEADIALLKQSGGGKSDVFVAYYNATKYDDIINATKENKVVLLYDGDKFIASLTTIEGNDNALVFAAHNIANMTEITEYVCMPSDIWSCNSFNFVSNVTLRETISSENPDFVDAVQACFPDADTMSFPLENPVGEVSAE